jgi:hypothetical protein
MKPWQRRQLDRLAQAHAASHYSHPAPADDSFTLAPMDESTIGRPLAQAARRIGPRLDAARDPAEMRRLITLRKGLRLMLEPLAK